MRSINIFEQKSRKWLNFKYFRFEFIVTYLVSSLKTTLTISHFCTLLCYYSRYESDWPWLKNIDWSHRTLKYCYNLDHQCHCSVSKGLTVTLFLSFLNGMHFNIPNKIIIQYFKIWQSYQYFNMLDKYTSHVYKNTLWYRIDNVLSNSMI